jgi:hypothetical protein
LFFDWQFSQLTARFNMSTATLSTRVARLEKQVARLLARQPPQPGRDDWKKVVGMFDGDEMMERIIEHGAAIRRAERRKARRG